MLSVFVVLLLLAAVLIELWAAFSHNQPRQVSLVPLGIAFLAAAFLIQAAARLA